MLSNGRSLQAVQSSMFENIYHLKENIIPEQFCDKIIKDGEIETIKKAGIADGNNANRSSSISWIEDKELQKTLSYLVKSANDESNWNFSLKEFESLQFTIYNKGDHYNWHTDNHVKPYRNNTIRKLSFTICLNDEYEGGNFSICDPHPEPDLSITTTFKLKKGDMIIFPSHVWHKVDKIIKGTRKSLVGWVVGRPFI
jgi:PKHD-type hydroxylase